MYSLQLIADVFKCKVVYHCFFQFWLIFPNGNYQSRSIEYKFNWCCHHTLHLMEKTFPIFKNLLKASGTTMKVLSCSKIPLTSMCVDRFESCLISSPGSRPLQFFPTLLNWSRNPLEETLLQMVLENKLTKLRF